MRFSESIEVSNRLAPPAPSGEFAGRTYYCMLEDVDIYGNTTMHGPVVVMAGPSLRGKP